MLSGLQVFFEKKFKIICYLCKLYVLKLNLYIKCIKKEVWALTLDKYKGGIIYNCGFWFKYSKLNQVLTIRLVSSCRTHRYPTEGWIKNRPGLLVKPSVLFCKEGSFICNKTRTRLIFDSNWAIDPEVG